MNNTGWGGARKGAGRKPGKTAEKLRSLTISIPKETFDKVEKKAGEKDQSLSGWIVDAVNQRLDKE